MKTACTIGEATLNKKVATLSLRFEHQINLDIDLGTPAGQSALRKICDGAGLVRLNDIDELKGKAVTVEIAPNKVKSADGLTQSIPLFFVTKIC